MISETQFNKTVAEDNLFISKGGISVLVNQVYTIELNNSFIDIVEYADTTNKKRYIDKQTFKEFFRIDDSFTEEKGK